jgi:hypothetical protein
MYKCLFVFFCLIFFIHSNAQLSIQLSPGIMNYGGDLQNKVYTLQDAQFSIGGSLIYSIDKFGIKGSLTYGNVQGDDSTNTGFTGRNLSFGSKIYEASLCLQYDFFRLDENRKFTPYIFAGIAIFHFSPYTYYKRNKVFLSPIGTEGQGLALYPDRKFYKLNQAAIPLGIGFKYRVADNIYLGFEFNSRFLFTDYLDDVSSTYPDQNALFMQRGQRAVDLSYRGNETNPGHPFPSGSTRGNPKLNDNYYTTTFSFIYVLPEGFLFGGGGKSPRNVGCPVNVR